MGRTNAEGLYLQRQSARAAYAAPDAAFETTERPAREGWRFQKQSLFQRPGPERQGERLGSFSRGAPAITGCRQAGCDRLSIPQVVLAVAGLLPIHRGPAGMAPGLRYRDRVSPEIVDDGGAARARPQIPRRARLHLCGGR